MSETSQNSNPVKKVKKKRVNVRRPEVMEKVQAEVSRHYKSSLVEQLRAAGGTIAIKNTTIKLAKQFGFCYGVERAIDLAYATRRVFPEQNLWLIGEIIHNPDVNAQLEEMGIRQLEWRELNEEYDQLGEQDVVIVPAFGAPTHFMEKIEAQGCTVIDTTCGDVMSVWRRVKSYAKEDITSIIHGKKGHEETLATASRALTKDGKGHYIVVLTLEETEHLCRAIRGEMSETEFFQIFKDAVDPQFSFPEHLHKVGVANQTTMLKGETLEVQKRVQEAIEYRDGDTENFRVFDTICGATQERQDALFEMLESPLDLLLVVGGYNSSNTSHLVEIGEDKGIPSFFIRNASCITDLERITHFDLHSKQEIESTNYASKLLGTEPVTIGITAGASCPNNLIEQTITKIALLRNISTAELSTQLALQNSPKNEP